MGKRATLYLAFGGPRNLDDIHPFLSNLFNDYRIIPVRSEYIRNLIANRIINKRIETTSKNYSEIGGRSPQWDDLEWLSEHFVVATIWPSDSIGKAVSELVDSGVEEVLILTSFPQYSRSTFASALDRLEDALRANPAAREITWRMVADHTHDEDWISMYVDAIDSGKPVLFSYHGLPKSFIKKGDPYLESCERELLAIREQSRADIRHAFQSRADARKWLSPSPHERLEELKKEGFTEIQIATPSFVSEHIENLHEIDIELREEVTGIEWTRIPSPPRKDAYLSMLKKFEENADQYPVVHPGRLVQEAELLTRFGNNANLDIHSVQESRFRLLWISLGLFFVGVGSIGIVVPGLPTTPLMILAAACFSRSSQRFYDWVLANRLFGRHVKNYREGLGMPLKGKVVVLASMWVFVLFAIFFAIPIELVMVRATTFVSALIGTRFILNVPRLVL